MTALTSTVVYVVVWGLLVFGVLPICFYRCGVGGSKKSDFRIIFFYNNRQFSGNTGDKENYSVSIFAVNAANHGGPSRSES
jgi:hypothetical protein